MNVFDAFWVATTLQSATPLLFAASGEVVSERTGVLNIGLEGMMLMGAFFGFYGAYLTGNLLVAILCGAAAGALLAGLMALLAINARANQIVVGLGLNLLALGMTSFLFRRIFSGNQILISVRGQYPLGALGRLPFVGEAFFRQPVLVYVSLATVAAVWALLHQTTWGLGMRAAGEDPEALDASGSDPIRTRWIGTLLAGALAGLGGAFLSTSTGVFIEGMTAGRGYLAIAAVIFGRWRPVGVLLACLVFGAADALQLRLQSIPFIPRTAWLGLSVIGLIYVVSVLAPHRAEKRRPLAGVAAIGGGLALFALGPHISLPAQFWRALPYVVTLAVLAGVVGQARMPSNLAIAYRRGGNA
jgi:simple sugar transport system permease protein